MQRDRFIRRTYGGHRVPRRPLRRQPQAGARRQSPQPAGQPQHHAGQALDEDPLLARHRAFVMGVTHFDLANNYGQPPGNAESLCGKIFKEMPRDELIISTKAGYRMWPGPYGEWGSRKYLLASCDQSLKRMGLDYVDIFYSHRPDPDTPLEETLGALDLLVRQGFVQARYLPLLLYGLLIGVAFGLGFILGRSLKR